MFKQINNVQSKKYHNARENLEQFPCIELYESKTDFNKRGKLHKMHTRCGVDSK